MVGKKNSPWTVKKDRAQDNTPGKPSADWCNSLLKDPWPPWSY